MPNGVAFVRITRSYEFLQRIIGAWALKCDKIIVYEHCGEETEKIHVHVLMSGMVDTWDNFKKIAKRLLPFGEDLNGNNDWSFKKKYEYRPKDTIKYMSKGNLQPKYNKGYTQEEVDAARESWVEQQPARTKDQELYQKFVDSNEGCEYWEYDTLKQAAKRFAFWECGRVWSARASAIYRLCLYTHAMTYNILLPDQLDIRM